MATTVTSILESFVSTATGADLEMTSAADFKMAGGSDAASDTMMERMSGDMAKSVPEHLHFVMSAVVGPIFCFVGMLGNLLSIVTWSRPKMRSSTGRYLIGQAVADFGVLLFFILFDSIMAWNPEAKYSPVYGWFFCYIAYPGFFFCVVCSVWYTVGVTADRHIMVCWITKAKRYCSEKRANVGLLLITLNAFMINFPHHFSYTTTSGDDSGNSNDGPQSDAVVLSNTTTVLNNNTIGGRSGMGEGGEVVMEAERTPSFKKTEFTTGPSGNLYEFWIHCMVLIIIPWITIFVMNIMIIRAVNKSNKKNADKKTIQAAQNSKNSENQITRLLLAVTFSFLFFIGMQCIIQCMWMQRPAGFNWDAVDSSFALAKCGVIFNSSLNFFLYCLTGKRFRKELMRLLRLRDTDSTVKSSSMSDRPSTLSTSRNTTSSTNTGI